MRILILALPLLLVAQPAAAAPADDTLLATYRSMCFDTQGSPQKALAIADASGWKALAAPPDAASVNMVQREKVVGATRWKLIVFEKDLPAGDVPFATHMTSCMTTVEPTQGDVRAQARALMGSDPNAKDDTNMMWAFYDHPGGRDFNVQLSPADRAAAIQKGPFVMVGATQAPQGSGLAYVAVRTLKAR